MVRYAQEIQLILIKKRMLKNCSDREQGTKIRSKHLSKIDMFRSLLFPLGYGVLQKNSYFYLNLR
jgi:hypothetical protein